MQKSSVTFYRLHIDLTRLPIRRHNTCRTPVLPSGCLQVTTSLQTRPLSGVLQPQMSVVSFRTPHRCKCTACVLWCLTSLARRLLLFVSSSPLSKSSHCLLTSLNLLLTFFLKSNNMYVRLPHFGFLIFYVTVYCFSGLCYQWFLLYMSQFINFVWLFIIFYVWWEHLL